MIDDEHIHGSFCRFEAESELFLKSREYGWADGGIHRPDHPVRRGQDRVSIQA